ncbi:hypothetical protein BHM03_00016891 [Ensete ventricosum]|nr:hypothetical protein BHM03_00016891 [Ensete ventricosum]
MRSDRCPPLIKHASIPDGSAIIHILLVVDRKTSNDSSQDAPAGKLVHRRHNKESEKTTNGPAQSNPEDNPQDHLRGKWIDPSHPCRGLLKPPELVVNGDLPPNQGEGPSQGP